MGKNKKSAESKSGEQLLGGMIADQQTTGEQKDAEQKASEQKAGEQKAGEQKTGQQKKQKQQKQQKPPPAPQLLFHESLGKELTQKFSDITDNVQRPTVAGYFASGFIEDQVQKNGTATVVTTVQKTVIAEPQNGVAHQPETPEPKSEAVQVDLLTSPREAPPTPTEAETVDVVEKKTVPGKMYSLSDMNAFQTIEQLVARHGRMTHMGVRDHNYDFFLNKSKTGVISYRLVDDKVAVISGDPICPVLQYTRLLEEFGIYCKHNRWQWAIQGASKDMANIAKANGWTTVQYGIERALNVQTNPVLLGSEGKRIRTQCKQLQKAVNVGIYCPAYTRDLKLEQQIVDMYDNWRSGRNTSRSVQAYVTVFDLLSLHRLMIFVYTHDAAGKLLGFAALRRLQEGYHIDPITVDPDAARGMTDLLLVASMALLKESNITRLVLGVEPLDELGEITGMSKALERLTRKSHKLISAELPLGGKKGFNDRFRPDDAFEEKLFMIYPNSPSIKQSVAMAHFANIHLHEAVKQRVAREVEKRRRNSEEEDVNGEGLSPPEAHTASEVAARPRSTQRSQSDGLQVKRRQSDEIISSDKLHAPSRRERASSAIRFFRRNSDEDRKEALTNLSIQDVKLPPERQPEDNLAVRPSLHQRHSSSLLRLLNPRTNSHDSDEKYNHTVQVDDASLLVPPGHERASSRSSSRIRSFRGKSSDRYPSSDRRGRDAQPMPLVG